MLLVTQHLIQLNPPQILQCGAGARESISDFHREHPLRQERNLNLGSNVLVLVRLGVVVDDILPVVGEEPARSIPPRDVSLQSGQTLMGAWITQLTATISPIQCFSCNIST